MSRQDKTSTNIRLKQIQSQECLSKSPLVFWPYRTFTRTDIKRFMFSMITFCFQQDFTFDVSPSKINRITGGKIFLRSIIDNLTRGDLRSFRNQQILFLEQLTSLDGKILLDWRLIRHQNFVISPAIYCT